MSKTLVRVGALFAASAISACATAQPEPAHPDFTGVWSGVLTTSDSSYWKIADLTCFAGCPVGVYERLTERAADPAIAARPREEVQAEDRAFQTEHYASHMTAEGVTRLQRGETVEDLETYCEPYGLLREAMNPLPVRITDEGETLLFTYEEWNLSRTIHMTQTAPPPGTARTLLGWSAGRYEGDALVIESTAIAADYLQLRIGSYSDEAHIVERYTIEEDPRRLVLELTITDPVTLTKPFVWTKTWLATPDVELFTDACEGVPGRL